MKVLSTRKIYKFLSLSFTYLLTSCSPSHNGLICYEENPQAEVNLNERKVELSILISNSKKTGFVKWSVNGAGSEWVSVDFLTTPDTISFKHPFRYITLSTKIDRSTLVGVTSPADKLTTINIICKKANIQIPTQKV